ncbi:MAG: DUF494 family protein [Ignavibacteriales bacterium]|nr:DUF494 family protein [Ignavibacteriales bacterium]
MTAEFVEVLAKILDGLDKNFSLEEVNKKLSKEKSLNKQTISAAFSWLYDKKLNKFNGKFKLKRNNYRFLSNEEINFLGAENHNYISHLINVGLINASDLDSILDQLFLYPGETITKEEINWIILFSLVDFSEDVPPGSRFLLYSSDTIN